jgi:hypothetical protein
MDPKVIYRKTDKGQEEMATRVHHLPSRERSILVLVDGKRTGAELVEKSRHFGDGEAFLNHLVETGFVEPVADGARLPPPASELRHVTPSPAVSPAPVTVRPRSPASPGSASTIALTETINFARHFLLGALGPDADELAARLESSRNLKELAQTLAKGREALAVLAGRRKADEFWQGVLARLPQVGTIKTD